MAVVTCMDSRMDIFQILGLAHGEAHIIRNAGGVVTDDVIRSLVVSQRRLETREIVLIHHTDCGLQRVTDSLRPEGGQIFADPRLPFGENWPARGIRIEDSSGAVRAQDRI